MSNEVVEDIRAYLKSDATLLALLGATADAPKIYPSLAGTDAIPPHIEYMSPGDGGSDEIIDEYRITLKVTVDNYDFATANAIIARLNYLLDFRQRGATIPIPSDSFFIYYIRKNGGMDDKNDDTKQVIKVRNYDIKYVKKSA